MTGTGTPPAAKTITPTHYGAATGVVIGLVLWALGRYVFQTGVPQEVQIGVYALLPGILGGATAFITRREAK